MTRLLIATNNSGKQREFRRLLSWLRAEVLTPAELGLDLDVDEPHDTYEANARAKADAFTRASGVISIADDSGIEVAALDWGPGVRSARWAGARGQEADRMLDAMRGKLDRRARMVCALAVACPADPDPIVNVFTRTMDGEVASERRGVGGFGYDPIFVVDGRTAAELPEADKDRLSHRGQAVAAASAHLTAILADR